MKVLAFLLEFLLHLTEKIFLTIGGVKPCYVVKAFMGAFKGGLDLFINDENLGKRALGKHTGVKSEKLLEADYKNFAHKYLPRDPTTTQKSMDLVFETMGIKDVEEKKRIFDAVVDNSFL